jgi:hypothetical protein
MTDHTADPIVTDPVLMARELRSLSARHVMLSDDYRMHLRTHHRPRARVASRWSTMDTQQKVVALMVAAMAAGLVLDAIRTFRKGTDGVMD